MTETHGKKFRIRQEKPKTEAPEGPVFYNIPENKPPYIPEYLDSGIEIGDLIKIVAG